MITNNNDPEHFSCDFSKMKFDSVNPSKETRKTIRLFGIMVILILIVFLLGIAFLPINPWWLGGIGGTAVIVSAVRGSKNGRSP
jgi:hypothetical protein